jgi:hypothetical protein
MELRGKRSALPILAFPAAALAIAAGCVRIPRAAVPVSAATSVPLSQINEYVGSEACGSCHAVEWRSHQNSHHAHTLAPMTVAGLGKKGPPTGRLPGTDTSLTIREGHYVLAQSSTGKTLPLDYALGSGKQGLTFITIESENSLLEMGKSYSLRTAKWYTTPGQEAYDKLADSIGLPHQGADARNCIQCHAVTVSRGDLHPEPRFMGVGCESCHGPGSAHIAAVKAHQTADLRMEHLADAGGARINQLCGDCHGTPQFISTRPDAKSQTHRFMPYGLSLSRCFQASSGRFTCITCHNPHTNASTDQNTYEAICLSCHSRTSISSARPQHTPAASQVNRRVVQCPVNPRKGCINCHMPTRHVFPINPIPIAMADHWIRVMRKPHPHKR